MAVDRRVLFAVAAGALIYSGLAPALGMGEITLHSALNQPLSAEIELLDAEGLAADEFRVALASHSDFERAGVTRAAFLHGLSFTPVVTGGRSHIRVASNKSVREPYLNFLVEITRAKSRILREYTVLLDPLPSGAVGEHAIDSLPSVQISPRRSGPSRSVSPRVAPLTTHGEQDTVADGLQEAAPIANVLPAQQNQTVDTKGQVAAVQRQLLEALAASRDENEQLGQMLTQLQQEIEAVHTELEGQREPTDPVTATSATAAPDSESAKPAAPIKVPAALVTQDVGERPDTKVNQGQPKPLAVTSVPWWHDWLMPGAGLLACVLLLGAASIRRRVRSTAGGRASKQAGVVQSNGLPLTRPETLPDMPRQPAHASVSETGVLEAADIYLTYGRRDDAMGVLLRGIEKAPEQLDLHLRLLGLMAESGDAEGYNSAAAGYLQAGGSPAQLSQLLALHPATAMAMATGSQEPLPVAGIGTERGLTSGAMPAAEQMAQLEPNPEYLVRLNQAAASIKQGDIERACMVLEGVASDGDEPQRLQVSELLARIA